MRIPIFCLLFLTGVAGTIKAQTETQTDPYNVNLVQSAIKMYAQGIHVSILDKRLRRLGDQVSIALIKIYSVDELSKPETVRSFLPVIQEAFSNPPAITQETDKKPSVTLILLKYLRGSITDVQTQQSIDNTIKSVQGMSAIARIRLQLF